MASRPVSKRSAAVDTSMHSSLVASPFARIQSWATSPGLQLCKGDWGSRTNSVCKLPRALKTDCSSIRIAFISRTITSCGSWVVQDPYPLSKGPGCGHLQQSFAHGEGQVVHRNPGRRQEDGPRGLRYLEVAGSALDLSLRSPLSLHIRCFDVSLCIYPTGSSQMLVKRIEYTQNKSTDKS